MSYNPPNFSENAFNCPHCNAYAHQIWLSGIRGKLGGRPSGEETRLLTQDFSASQCEHCKAFALWKKEQMVYPNGTLAPLPNEDMPEEIKEDFNEARLVFPISPRSSAALLRLVIQNLCEHLGYQGKTIDNQIADMVAKGLSPQVQQAFDAVRVLGNQAVHPGQIDLRDDPDVAFQLFHLVNFIVDEMIAKPRRIEKVYSKLPPGTLQHIEDRNKKKKS